MAGKGAVAAIAIGGLFFIGLILFLAYYYRESLGLTSSSTTDSSENITFSSPIPSPAPSSPAPSSPAPASVTINGETFDPTGYTISSGWIWNRKPLVGYTTSVTSNVSECRQRCIDKSPPCTHFARSESDGTCYLNETDPYLDHESNRAHIRGFKKDGSNEYSRPVYISGYEDTARYDNPSMKQEMTITQCVQKCTSNTNCVAWVYRTDKHLDPGSKKTCITFGTDSSKSQYREGGVGR